MELETQEKSADIVRDKQYWSKELKAADKALDKFHRRGKKTVDRFLDRRDETRVGAVTLNLFHSNIVTVKAMMFGQVPAIEVDRRYQDAGDDTARVATLILERMLNNDIQFNDRSFQSSLNHALEDFLLPGLGVCRIRYDMETETREEIRMDATEEGESYQMESYEEMTDEWVETNYVHWKDFKWSPGARTWDEVRWVAFRTYLTEEEAKERWPDAELTYKNVRYKDDDNPDDKSTTDLAEIWEIWCKDSEYVYEYSDGADKLLGKKEDPLELEGFFPCVKPLMANISTDSLVPTPDFYFAQDLYNEIDLLEARVSILTKAVKAVGVYDKAATGVKRMLEEGVDNDLIPIDNWAMFGEKGGLRGQIDWMPLDSIVGALDKLIQLRDNTIGLLYQSTGLSDIMRGQATQSGVSATEQSLKAKFASVRIQAMQDRFAQFATDLQKLKAQVISKHYSPETIAKQSNIMMTPDAQLAGQAIELIKNEDAAIWRIQVLPESVAMVDYAALKQERMEYINSLAMFMQSSAPLAALDPGITPYLIELLKWGLAGFKGSQNIEGVLDRAVDSAIQAQEAKKNQPPPPDPKVEADKAKAQADAQQQQQKMQGEMAKQQQSFQMQQQQQQTSFQMEMQKLASKHEADMQKIYAKLQADIEKEAAQARYSVAEKMAMSNE